jgi:hypothetical protein
MPATSKKRVPLASGTVQFKYVTPCRVHVVGRSEITSSGSLYANAAWRENVIGISNELPMGMTPNIVGGLVVLPLVRSDEEGLSLTACRLARARARMEDELELEPVEPGRVRGTTSSMRALGSMLADTMTSLTLLPRDVLREASTGGVTGDSRLVGQLIERLEHCGG